MLVFWKYVALAAVLISAVSSLTMDARPRAQHRQIGGLNQAAKGNIMKAASAAGGLAAAGYAASGFAASGSISGSGDE